MIATREGCRKPCLIITTELMTVRRRWGTHGSTSIPWQRYNEDQFLPDLSSKAEADL